MAASACPKCGGPYFELKENSPAGSKVAVYFVQCSACGAVVGAMEWHDIGSALAWQHKAIEAIASKLEVSV
jgi:hypothetical protein